jgi:hypothetical protein
LAALRCYLCKLNWAPINLNMSIKKACHEDVMNMELLVKRYG